MKALHGLSQFELFSNHKDAKQSIIDTYKKKLIISKL